MFHIVKEDGESQDHDEKRKKIFYSVSVKCPDMKNIFWLKNVLGTLGAG